MDVLTDAEYSRLTAIEKAQYWHARYQELDEKYEELKKLYARANRSLKLITDALQRA